ncbi:hypothetical protein QZH41_004814 [Actinostola sp. cb2023]|nr:hypothetical protein QZH41_004814 [Actinostola sp. cb2023]
MPALVKALEERRFHQAKLLVKKGYDVNDKNRTNGRTALLAACLIQQEETAYSVVKWLLEQGASALARDSEGLTVVMHACIERRTRIVQLLLKENEVNLAARDNHGNSVPLYAVRTGDLTIIDAVLSEFVKRRIRGLDQANDIGETPLTVAAKLGYHQCIDRLLKKGKCLPKARDVEIKITVIEEETDHHGNSINKENNGNVSKDAGKNPFKFADLKRNGFPIDIDLNGSSKVRDATETASLNDCKTHVSGQVRNVLNTSLDDKVRSQMENSSEELQDCKDNEIFGNRLLHQSHAPTSGKINNEFPPRQDKPVKRTAVKLGKGSNVADWLKPKLNSGHAQGRAESETKRWPTIFTKQIFPDTQIPKRTKASIKTQLPKLFCMLQDQHSSSYRLKAEPPKLVQRLHTRSYSSSPRAEVLRRFAKAGFASIAINKLSQVQSRVRPFGVATVPQAKNYAGVFGKIVLHFG